MHEDPLAGRAALPGAQVGRLEDCVDRGREVGVVQHHERPVARPAPGSAPCPAARADTDRPVATEPMKATASTPGWPASASPATGPAPFRKFSAPAGRPVSFASTDASTAEQAAVVGAASHTTVLPAASAGANSSAAIVYGQFQGTTIPATPSGTRWSSTRRPGSTDGGTRPSRRTASAAAMRR